jgi:hypothetical protein
MYTVDYFIKKFSVIPYALWMTGDYGEGSGPKCALGHCGMSVTSYVSISEESTALSNMITAYMQKVHNCTWTVPDINDGNCPFYQKGHPKDNILAVLEDVRKFQQPAIEQKPERVKVVYVAETLREEAKEVCLS